MKAKQMKQRNERLKKDEGNKNNTKTRKQTSKKERKRTGNR